MIESAQLTRWLSIIRLQPIRPLSGHLNSPSFDLSPRKDSMDFASSLTGLVNNIWGLVSKPLGYVCNLRKNVTSLRKEAEELKVKSRDVAASVEHEERGGGVRRKNEVAKWLGDVQEFEGRVDRVLREAEERDRIRRLSRCLPRNCWSSYRSGETVDQMLNEARDLQKKKVEIGDLTLPLPPPPVIGMPTGKTVGLDTSLDEVWKWLVDEKQIVIGLYGLGGVGKTTLMKKINEKLSHENPGFQVVIWVVVSRQVSKETIRDAIRKRLGIQNQIWSGWSQEEKVHHLCQALTEKKFLLLIDDLWARLDLPEIGVPHGLENGSKIVFTTREKQICAQMGAEKTSFEVRCLTTQKAMELFEKNAGESTVKSRPDIQELANKIADECKGLPLALITVGRAMAGIANPQEWEQALATLRDNPHKFSGMEEEVYHILEFSYDRLDDSVRRCFIYCCLFPEDYYMRPHDLLGLWIGEGLLGGSDDVYGLRIEGERVLGRLNRACLLESGHDDDDEAYVKMHDVIRDMAMWIARDRGQKENKWQVIEREEDLSVKMISKWGDVEKVSIWGKLITNIDQIPSRCSQLETLIVRETNMQLVPRGFFNSMAAHLIVLDLSDNKDIQSIPEDICTLINLQYLNLSGTGIQELPRDIDKLTHLRWLLLESMRIRILIPRKAITSLPLYALSMWESRSKEEEEMVEELGHMQHLADLSIQVYRSSSVEKIFQSQNLQRSIRRARIEDCLDMMHIVISHSLLHLELLILINCVQLMHMEIRDGIGRGVPNCSCFPSLTQVVIFKCKLSDLSWLVHAPNLQHLRVQVCPAMEKIIGDGFAQKELTALRLFSRLEYVLLSELPKLTSICDKALSFPPGVKFIISKCPCLRKLPLDSSSARRGGFSVEADGHWWNGFEWDPAARVTYRRSHRFQVEETTYGSCRSAFPNLRAEIRFLPEGPSRSPLLSFFGGLRSSFRRLKLGNTDSC